MLFPKDRVLRVLSALVFVWFLLLLLKNLTAIKIIVKNVYIVTSLCFAYCCPS